MRKILYIIFTALFIVACANMGSPDGGPYDETPPKIVRTSPKFGASNTSVKKIVLEFDEIVKLDNASENVIISPPQIEQPEIEAMGKKITIKLIDSIIPGTTYTIDFSDAIKDNNEGNSMGDYAFTFSTGGVIDTMQVSGYVLDASNLEPIKGIMVGVYALADSAEQISDTVFHTKALERISRTDESGHFVIKGLSDKYYSIFALKDQNQNYTYDQKSEMLAFTPMTFKPSSKSDIKADTIWHDSIHYDSIIYKGYTHFYPDDITLKAFTPTVQDRFLIKTERPQLNMFSLFFTSPSDTLPRLTGLNFEVDSTTFVIDATENKDSINYWIRDSLVYNLDTLNIQVDYWGTDTLGELSIMVDTLALTSKISKAKMEKQRKDAWEEWAKEYRKEYRAEMKMKEKEESEDKDKSKDKEKKKKIADEDIEVPPMPEELMPLRIDPAMLDPDKNITFTLPEPVDSVDLSKIRLFTKRDSVEVDEKFILRRLKNKELSYRLYAEWEPDSTYFLMCDTGLFVNIYGKRSDAIKKSIKVGGLDQYSTLFVVLQNADTSAVVQLLDGSDKVVKTVVSENGKADFYFLKPNKYYMRLFYDRNGNGEWDSGDYDKNLQPEEVYYYPNAMELKAQWEITQTFNPTSVPVAKQKPLAITKQKDAKKDRTRKSKNQERLEMKKNGNKGQSSQMSMPRF